MENQTTTKGWELIEVEKLKAGDSDQLSLLFKLLLPRVRILTRYYWRRGDAIPDDISDVTNDILVTIFSSLHKYKPLPLDSSLTAEESIKQETKGFRSWCYKVVDNVLRDKSKLESRKVKHEITTGLTHDLDKLEGRVGASPSSALEAGLLLEELLKGLSSQDRLILDLYIQGFSSREIATQLSGGMSHITVMTRLRRVMSKLVSHLRSLEGQPALRRGGTLDVRSDKKEVAS